MASSTGSGSASSTAASPLTRAEALARVRALFWQSGNVKVAAVTAFVAVPVLGLWYMNFHISAWARPRVLEAREWVLGRADVENGQLRHAMGMKAVVRPSDNLFAHSTHKREGEEVA
jgi:hypothetical protein